jgi:hypothetical protein
MTTTGERDHPLSRGKIPLLKSTTKWSSSARIRGRSIHAATRNCRNRTVHLFLQPGDRPALLRILSRSDSSIANRANPEIETTGNVSLTGSSRRQDPWRGK